MERTWRLIDSGPCGAFYNMALDESLAVSVRKNGSPPILRFYGWKNPAVSLGYFQQAADIDAAYCHEKDIPIVRRPTGGRAILHGDELTYSLAARTDRKPFSHGLLDSYRQIGIAFHRALRSAGASSEVRGRRERGRVLSGSAMCFHSSSYGEILVDGKKIMGSAQRRWKDGMLQQGSMPYAFDAETMCGVFRLQGAGQVKDGMTGIRDVLSGLYGEEELKKVLRDSFEETFGVSFLLSCPTPEEEHQARELEAQKYRQSHWNFRR